MNLIFLDFVILIYEQALHEVTKTEKISLMLL